MISYPESDIIWIYTSNNHKPQTNQHAMRHYSKSHNKNNSLAFTSEMEDESFIPENNLILKSELKYSILLKVVNKTHKHSSITIDIDDEKDFGVYACFANNSVGSRSIRFFIYGGTYMIIRIKKLKLF